MDSLTALQVRHAALVAIVDGLLDDVLDQNPRLLRFVRERLPIFEKIARHDMRDPAVLALLTRGPIAADVRSEDIDRAAQEASDILGTLIDRLLPPEA